MRELDLSGRTEPFTPGETVVVVEVMNGKVWTVRPVTVIKDSADEIALWLAPGTTTLYPSGPQHGEHTVRQWIAGEWELINRTWGPPGKLRLTRPGDAFEVWASPGMHDDGTPWYVNLQDPLRRVGAGFTTMDHLLDILVSPDLQSWEWKDEAEFAFARQAGLFSASRTAEIRAMGLDIISALESGRPPWDPSWATFAVLLARSGPGHERTLEAALRRRGLGDLLDLAYRLEDRRPRRAQGDEREQCVSSTYGPSYAR